MNFLGFPLVKFLKIWQIDSKIIFYVSRSLFVREIYKTSSFFCSGERHEYEKNKKKTANTNPTIFVFKIDISLDVIWCENFRTFH